MYGVEAAQASPLKMANLAAAVIHAFKSKNNNHNANNFSPRSPRPRTISTLQLRSSLEGCCKSGGLLAKRRGPRTDSKTSFRTMLTSISKMGSGLSGTGMGTRMKQRKMRPSRMSNRTHPQKNMRKDGVTRFCPLARSGSSLSPSYGMG